jgi:hypothetical protein
MEKRHETTPEEQVGTAPGAAPHRHQTASAAGAAEPARDPPTAFEWQAVLLRYLPDPRGSHHSVKRFAAR